MELLHVLHDGELQLLLRQLLLLLLRRPVHRQLIQLHGDQVVVVWGHAVTQEGVVRERGWSNGRAQRFTLDLVFWKDSLTCQVPGGRGGAKVVASREVEPADDGAVLPLKLTVRVHLELQEAGSSQQDVSPQHMNTNTREARPYNTKPSGSGQDSTFQLSAWRYGAMHRRTT